MNAALSLSPAPPSAAEWLNLPAVWYAEMRAIRQAWDEGTAEAARTEPVPMTQRRGPVGRVG